MKPITNISKPYVCISIQSTAQMKYWNYENGWYDLIQWLETKGIHTVVIDKHEIFGSPKERMNMIPSNAINMTGGSLDTIINLLQGSLFFIGLSSGLSWLAWALGVKVVMISGMTAPEFEFSSNCIRIYNPNVCNGCFNDPECLFDKSDWMCCPRHKNTERQFECTTKITIEQVKKAITPLIQ